MHAKEEEEEDEQKYEQPPTTPTTLKPLSLSLLYRCKACILMMSCPSNRQAKNDRDDDHEDDD